MRHGKKFNHLGRKVGHRKAMFRNMASSLILNKRIKTTVAKAKALRQYVEPVITKAKGNESGDDLMNASRVAFKYLQDKHAVKELFTSVAGKVADRDGGYTRIIKLGARLGDNAEMAIIELVDFNDMYTQSKSAGKTSKRRRRRGGKKAEVSETVSEVEETNAEEIATDIIEDSSDSSDQVIDNSDSEEEKKED
ncbi:MAG: 50S ribosomal protein L17 [Bacteroidia bacterium]